MEKTVSKTKTDRLGAKFHHFDFTLFIVVMALCAFGLVMVFSASYYYAQVKQNDGMYFLKRQLIFFGLGFAGLLGLSFIPYKFWQKAAPILYLIGFAGLMWTLLFGVKINEARRWVNVFGYQFQPSEFSKIMIVIMLAALMCDKRVSMMHFILGIVPCLVVLAIYAVPVLLQPNFSLVIILGLTTYAMIYLGGSKRSHRLLLLIVGAAAITALILIAPYRMRRLTAFIDPEADPDGAGYQILQSQIAFANGGLLGQGLNFSRQKLLFLPERENDYIFAIIAEELGFLGCLAVIAAYCFIIYKGITIAQTCGDKFGKLVAGGITTVIAVQSMLNIGVVIGALPTTGQTLPFISYGGTSLMTFMGAAGILLNISRYTEVKTLNAKRKSKKE